VLTTWFPYFARWSDNMPDRAIWQRLNQLSEADLAQSRVGPMAGLRPYLAGMFDRFLHAYRSL